MARRAERAEKAQQHLADARAAEERAAEEQRKKAVAATARAAQVQVPSIVPGAAAHAKSLKDKKKWRRSAAMQALMPSGADKIATFPRCEEERFGEEGEEGDRLFDAAMATFKADEFGENHVQKRVIRQKIGQVQAPVDE